MFNKVYTFVFSALLLVSPAITHAENFDYRFNVRLGPAKIGEMEVSGRNEGGSYSTTAHLFTTGVVGAIYDVSYEYRTEGKVGARGVLLPTHHVSTNIEKRKTTQLEIRYSGDRVVGVLYTPERDVPATATGYKRTVDPMTLIYFLLRPASPAQTCAGAVELFDGQSRIKVAFTNVERSANGQIECDISYAGEKGGGIALSSLVFVPDSNGLMRIKEFAAETNIGTLAIKVR